MFKKELISKKPMRTPIAGILFRKCSARYRAAQPSIIAAAILMPNRMSTD
jgi:hypothetical protein